LHSCHVDEWRAIAKLKRFLSRLFTPEPPRPSSGALGARSAPAEIVAPEHFGELDAAVHDAVAAPDFSTE
jgi:hypothetical protein